MVVDGEPVAELRQVEPHDVGILDAEHDIEADAAEADAGEGRRA